MRTVKKGRSNVLDFVAAHLAPWDANVEKIGLTKEQIDELRAALDQARAAFDAARVAREAARAATLRSNLEVGRLRAMASAYVRTIRATAAWGGPSELSAPALLALAEIPPEGRRGGGHRVPRTPGAIERLSAVVESSGAVVLTWTARGASAGSGAAFEVFKKPPGQREYALAAQVAGLSSTRRAGAWTDAAAHLAAGPVSYAVRARRGAAAGPISAAVTVDVRGGGLSRAA